MRKTAGVIGLLIGLLIGAPWVTGLLVKRTYQQWIAAANAQNDVMIELQDYHCGWFTSQAKLKVVLVNANLRKLWVNLGVADPNLTLEIEQAIQHGPVFFKHASQLKALVGLAAIQNKVKLSPDILAVLKPLTSASLILADEDLISLTGKHFTHLELAGFEFFSPIKHFQYKFEQGLLANIWLGDTQQKIAGDIDVQQFALNDPEENIFKITGAHLALDLQRSVSGVWLGKSELSFALLTLKNMTGPDVLITNLKTQSEGSESDGVIQGSRNLSIEKINVNNEVVGPLNLKLKVHGLDAETLHEMILSVQQIILEGEQYGSQLKFKLSTLAPDLFEVNSGFAIEEFKLETRYGRLKVNGEAGWPEGGAANATTFGELVQTASAKVNVRIAQVLADQLALLAADLPYFRKLTPEKRNELLQIEDNIQEVNQQNFLMLSALVDHNYLSVTAGLEFLAMQKNDESLENYALSIKNLLLKREISLPISYFIYWQYAEVKRQVNLFDTLLDKEKNALSTQFQTKIKEWLKGGYITKEHDDYATTILKNANEISLNGKPI